MTRKFASIELARLYEAQGYMEDALAMYNALDDDVLEGGAEVRAAVKRLELALLRQAEEPEAAGDDPGAFLLSTLDDLNQSLEGEGPSAPPGSDGQERIAGLMEKWLSLMVARKRLQVFKTLKG